jgi:hypothetical protein
LELEYATAAAPGAMQKPAAIEAKTKKMMMGGGSLPLTQDKNSSNDGHTTGKIIHNSYYPNNENQCQECLRQR